MEWRMNIGAIKRNCVSRRLAAIYDTPLGGQWVSNGSHAFRVDGLRLDADALEALAEQMLKDDDGGTEDDQRRDAD